MWYRVENGLRHLVVARLVSKVANQLRAKCVSEDPDRRLSKGRFSIKEIRRKSDLLNVWLAKGLEGSGKNLVGHPCFVFFVVVRSASILF